MENKVLEFEYYFPIRNKDNRERLTLYLNHIENTHGETLYNKVTMISFIIKQAKFILDMLPEDILCYWDKMKLIKVASSGNYQLITSWNSPNKISHFSLIISYIQFSGLYFELCAYREAYSWQEQTDESFLNVETDEFEFIIKTIEYLKGVSYDI